MRALVYRGKEAVELADRPVPESPDGGDALIRVAGTGIYGTDRKILLDRFPARAGLVLGHETIGVVAAVGHDVRTVHPGERMVVNPMPYCGGCGHCGPCGRRAANHCRNETGTEAGVDRDGTYAGYAVLPERFVERLPESMPFRRAVLLTEPLACVVNSVQASRRVVVTESDPYHLASAKAVSGHMVNAVDPRPEEPVVEAAGGVRPDVFDTAGVAVWDALDPAAGLPVEDLVTYEPPLERHQEAFALLARGGDGPGYGAMKVVPRSDARRAGTGGWREEGR